MKLRVGLQKICQGWHRPTRNAHIADRQIYHVGCESERVKYYAQLLGFSTTFIKDELRDFTLGLLKYLLNVLSLVYGYDDLI